MTEQKGKKSIEKIREVAYHAANAETAPAPIYRYRAVLFQFTLLLITATFGLLTVLVKTTPSFLIDLQITRGLQSIYFPLFRELMIAISWVGFSPQTVIISGFLVLVIYSFGLHWEALMAIVTVVSSTAINLLVKDLIQRPRPTAGLVNVFATLNSYSFPSGHVMFYLVFFGFIGFLAFSLLKPSIKRSLLLVFFGSLVALIGASRIYLGEHWASDVLGAYLLGSLTLAAMIQSYRWGKTRFFIHQPAAAGELLRRF